MLVTLSQHKGTFLSTLSLLIEEEVNHLLCYLRVTVKSLKKYWFNNARFIILICYFICYCVEASHLDVQLQQLNEQWAHINFELNSERKTLAFDVLLKQVKLLTSNYPEQAQAWAWSGIVKSSFAHVSHSLTALSYLKSAKNDLEYALKLNNNTLKGTVYSRLGMLYHKAPIWPIAFGDDDVAEVLLKRALVDNPHNKFSNFYYAQYLFDEHSYHHAKKHLLIAKQVPLRANCLVEDKHRQSDIELLLEKVEKIIAREPKR